MSDPRRRPVFYSHDDAAEYYDALDAEEARMRDIENDDPDDALGFDVVGDAS